MLDDYSEYEDIIDKWAHKHDGVVLSMAKIIKLAMDEFKETL